MACIMGLVPIDEDLQPVPCFRDVLHFALEVVQVCFAESFPPAGLMKGV